MCVHYTNSQRLFYTKITGVNVGIKAYQQKKYYYSSSHKEHRPTIWNGKCSDIYLMLYVVYRYYILFRIKGIPLKRIIKVMVSSINAYPFFQKGTPFC